MLVWKHAVRFRGEAKVTTWIYSVARNTAISRLRQDRGALPMDALLRDPGFPVSQRPDPEREAIASELARQLVSRIAKLSAVHRAVLVGMVRSSSAARLSETSRHHDRYGQEQAASRETSAARGLAGGLTISRSVASGFDDVNQRGWDLVCIRQAR